MVHALGPVRPLALIRSLRRAVRNVSAQASGGPGRPGVVAALAVTQTVGYGVLYYVFGVFLGPMSNELRISPTTCAGAMTVGVLVSGVMAVPVGRWLDARGGHSLMTTGSLLGSISVVAWSQVQTVTQLYAVFVLVGIASSMVLYGPAFSVLVAVLDPDRRTGALLAVTLVAGLASTVFIPLAGLLVESYGWRNALLILGLVHNVVTVPLHAIALRGTTPPGRSESDRRDRRAVSRALRDAGFWLITTGFVLHNAALTVIAVHLVLYLVTLGHPPAVAAGLTGLLGVFSVTGRVVTSILQRWLAMSSIAAGIFVLQGIAIAALPLVGRVALGVVACIIVFGTGFGVAAIATPAILLQRYGAAGYSTVAGALATPVLAARALAPLGAALIAEAIGYRLIMLPVAVACLGAGICLSLSWHLPAPGTDLEAKTQSSHDSQTTR